MISTRNPHTRVGGVRLQGHTAIIVATLFFGTACSGDGGGGGGTNPSGYTSGLALTNTTDLDATGPVGGPFDPAGSYTVTNQGSQALQWSASAPDSWIQLSTTFGFLQVGESVIVTATAGGAAANSLSTGTYASSITFRDMADLSADIVRPAALNVEDLTTSGLSVTPQIGFYSSGEEGGPFTPTSMTYTVTNTSTSDVTWDVVLSDNFVYVVGAANGLLGPGQSADVLLELDSLITDALSVGVHSATATFSNTGTGEVAASRDVSLNVLSTLAGWTPLSPSADSRVIYVSSSGNDSNDGLSPATPKQSLNAAEALMRDGFPDWMLLQRGDSWNGTLVAFRDKSGRNASEPMVVGAYGPESDPRPRITGNSNGFFTTGNASYCALVSIAFDSGNYSGSGGPVGIGWQATGTDILIEDCIVERFKAGIQLLPYSGANISNVRIRRTVVADSYSTSSHSQGMYVGYASGTGAYVDGVTIEGCLFDHNGWRAGVAPQTIFNHNFYIVPETRNVVIRDTISMRASATGAQMRSGGACIRSFFQQNPATLNFGLSQGGAIPTAGGVTGEITDSVFLEANDIGSAPRGGGLNLANIASATLSGNIIANNGSATDGGNAIHLDGDIENNPDVGINDIVIEDNLVYNWPHPINVSSSLSNFSNTTIRNNNLQLPTPMSSATTSVVLETSAGSITPRFAYSGNTYCSPNPIDQWFRIGGIRESQGVWMAQSGETDATFLSSATAFTDPDRNLQSYRDLVEFTSGSSLDAVSNELRQQRKGFWRPQYETVQIINHVREGFDLAPLQ